LHLLLVEILEGVGQFLGILAPGFSDRLDLLIVDGDGGSLNRGNSEQSESREFHNSIKNDILIKDLPF
jgi:hypothetical protein